MVKTKASYPYIPCHHNVPWIPLRHGHQYTWLWDNIWTILFFIFSSFHKPLKSPPIPSPLLIYVRPLISKSKWNNKRHHQAFRQYHNTHRRAIKTSFCKKQFPPSIANRIFCAIHELLTHIPPVYQHWKITKHVMTTHMLTGWPCWRRSTTLAQWEKFWWQIEVLQATSQLRSTFVLSHKYSTYI